MFPPQYKPETPAALMVFQDGGGYIHRDGNNPTLNVIDNLIAQKKIPVMISVFINPGDISDSPGTPTFNFVKAIRTNGSALSKTPCAARSTTPSATAMSAFCATKSSPTSQQNTISAKTLQPRHHRPLLRRHLRLQCRLADARSIQPRNFLDRQFRQHSVERRSRESRRRPGLSRQSPARTQAQHPRLAAGRLRRSGSALRQLAAGQSSHGQCSQS